ncbi:MAG: BON domain-containing protein, partial [Spirosomataceae bacterium]
DDHDISVKVSGTTVTLTGSAHSWYQHDETARIAWSTPGIWQVENELIVDYYLKLPSKSIE